GARGVGAVPASAPGVGHARGDGTRLGEDGGGPGSGKRRRSPASAARGGVRVAPAGTGRLGAAGGGQRRDVAGAARRWGSDDRGGGGGSWRAHGGVAAGR